MSLGSFLVTPDVMEGWTGTGRREWPGLEEWLVQRLEGALAAWFGGVEVVYEGTSHLSMAHKYVFGYHPHGLFPIGTCAFMAVRLAACNAEFR